MKSIIIALTLTSTFAFAETGTFTVNGMHCSGCKDMITSKVCKGEAAKNADSCTVTLTDEKKQTGQVVIVTKPGVKVNVAAVEAGIKAAGTDYKVAMIDLKDKITASVKTEEVEVMSQGVTTTSAEMTAETKETIEPNKKSAAASSKKIVKKMTIKKAATDPHAHHSAHAAPTAPAPKATTAPETK